MHTSEEFNASQLMGVSLINFLYGWSSQELNIAVKKTLVALDDRLITLRSYIYISGVSRKREFALACR